MHKLSCQKATPRGPCNCSSICSSNSSRNGAGTSRKSQGLPEARSIHVIAHDLQTAHCTPHSSHLGSTSCRKGHTCSSAAQPLPIVGRLAAHIPIVHTQTSVHCLSWAGLSGQLALTSQGMYTHTRRCYVTHKHILKSRLLHTIGKAPSIQHRET
jgi:hypothetical protein